MKINRLVLLLGACSELKRWVYSEIACSTTRKLSDPNTRQLCVSPMVTHRPRPVTPALRGAERRISEACTVQNKTTKANPPSSGFR